MSTLECVYACAKVVTVRMMVGKYLGPGQGLKGSISYHSTLVLEMIGG